MCQYRMLVLSNPIPGREAEYNDWYQNVHLADIVALPGFQSAQRFQLSRNMMVGGDAYMYMAIYEIDTDDLDQSLNALVAASERGAIPLSGALDAENVYAVVYSAFGEVVRTL